MPKHPAACSRRRARSDGTNRLRIARCGHGTDGSRQVFQDRKRLCRAAESRDTDCPWLGTVLGTYGRTSRARGAGSAAPPTNSSNRPISRQEPLLSQPTTSLRPRQSAASVSSPDRNVPTWSQVVRDLVRRHRRQGRRLEVLQEILDPSDVPLTELRGDLTADQEIHVTIPVRRCAVLTARPRGVDVRHPLRAMESEARARSPGLGVGASVLPQWRRGGSPEAAEATCRAHPTRRQAI